MANDLSYVDSNNKKSGLDLPAITFGFGPKKVLDHVSMTCRPGELSVVVGNNGAGKTSLLRCISGQYVSGGDILINNVSLKKARLEALHHIGFAIEATDLPKELTGKQFLDLMSTLKKGSLDQVQRFLEGVNVREWLDVPIGQCSYGTQKKIGIAAALLGQPSVLVADEIFNGLDLDSVWFIKHFLGSLIASDKMTVLITTHSLSWIEDIAHQVNLLFAGRIAHTWSMADLHQLQLEGIGLETAVINVLGSLRHQQS